MVTAVALKVWPGVGSEVVKSAFTVTAVSPAFATAIPVKREVGPNAFLKAGQNSVSLASLLAKSEVDWASLAGDWAFTNSTSAPTMLPPVAVTVIEPKQGEVFGSAPQLAVASAGEKSAGESRTERLAAIEPVLVCDAPSPVLITALNVTSAPAAWT